MVGLMMPCRILIVVNIEWSFPFYRLSLAKALKKMGCQVLIASGVERGEQEAIQKEGFRFVPLQLRRRSLNPWHELMALRELYRLYRKEEPDLVHHITVKPVIYGSLAARAASIPAVINTIPGLGYLFLQKGLYGSMIRHGISAGYRLALSSKRVHVIVQNPDDLHVFVSRRLVPPNRVVMILGSGVNIHEFIPSPEPAGTPVVLLGGRLIWEKGVGELVEASRLMKRQGIGCRVVVVGVPDPGVSTSVPSEILNRWQEEGLIEWWGFRNDMPSVLSQASVIALPSYYGEGVPKILLEAAAAGRPIVTTDAPGCREIVRQGVNGLLVPPRDPVALSKAIKTLVCDSELRRQMGARSREIVVAEFSEERVIKDTLNLYQKLLGPKWPGESSN